MVNNKRSTGYPAGGRMSLSLIRTLLGCSPTTLQQYRLPEKIFEKKREPPYLKREPPYLRRESKNAGFRKGGPGRFIRDL